MLALSKRNDEPERASRPYDKGRDGFVFGEGAGIVVLESAEHARAAAPGSTRSRPAPAYSADAHHIAQPDPSGAGADRAIRPRWPTPGSSPEQIVHVNAHATSTPQGDVAEARRSRRRSARGRRGVVVSATKSMTGHLLGAAGAVESIAAVLALRDRVAPPTINLEDPDDEVGLDIVDASRTRAAPRGAAPIAALNNSFGFGGHNVALVFTAA